VWGVGVMVGLGDIIRKFWIRYWAGWETKQGILLSCAFISQNVSIKWFLKVKTANFLFELVIVNKQLTILWGFDFLKPFN